MADSSLLSLPDELQEKVVQNVARGSITDLAAVKLRCKQLKEVSERPSVYRAFDLINLPQDLLDRMPRRFFLECFCHDNPDAILHKALVSCSSNCWGQNRSMTKSSPENPRKKSQATIKSKKRVVAR
ncbi:hypothetical protein Bca52824_011219 [Brassica carinata]|uniref:F-box domain-containing protein n=1 Tax=Brassica carinata TaxID=52824 RepID=A0A8X7WEX0_BRACI|nr:hypothetical protein Bca52824_011219 [Brassica carinata]